MEGRDLAEANLVAVTGDDDYGVRDNGQANKPTFQRRVQLGAAATRVRDRISASW